MPAVSWYNENSYRNFPFLDNQVVLDGSGHPVACQFLPTSAIVDCTMVMGIDALFDPAVNTIWLAQITNSGGILTFQFATDAPGAAGVPLIFTRNVTDPEYTLELSATAPATTAFASCADTPLWEGFLATGPLDDLLAILPSGQTLSFTTHCWQLEPAVIQTLSQAWLNGISLANYDRRHAVSVCAVSSEQLDRIFLGATCLTGNLKVKDGFQTVVSQDLLSKTITISGAVGGGAGSPCTEVPLYPGETPPGGSRYLSGGPACDQLVKSINGLSGPIIQLVGTQGVAVIPHPTKPHTILITADLSVLGQCAQPVCTEIPLPDLFDTGLNALGKLQSDCGDDAYWTYLGAPAKVTQSVPVGWLLDSSSLRSKWISPTCDPAYPNYPCGDYQLVTQFTLPANIDPQYMQITGQAAAASDIKAIYVNYQSAGISFSGPGAWQKFVLSDNFQSGLNTIAFSVRNVRPGPTGLRVEWLAACVSAQTSAFDNPQQASLALEC